MDIRTVETPELGDRSYLVHDGEVGVVIDPQRDLDRIEAEVAAADVRVTHVLETHIHNDYVSGGLELARRTGARYVVAGADDVAFDRMAAQDATTWPTGGLTVTALATPGHTVNHLAYLVEHSGAGAGAVFTGGNLLFGSVGRTDLVDPARTEEMTRRQYHSSRRLASRLPPQTLVYPTHGFGSFCSSGPAVVADVSTIAEQQRTNNALTTANEDTFVTDLMAGLAAYPRYYAHMGALNRAGAAAIDLTPPHQLDSADLLARLRRGDWVVDLRDRRSYAAGHAVGSVSFELSQNFTTYLGWVLPWDVPLVLLGESPEQIAAAQRDLARIGIDRGRLAGAAAGPITALTTGTALSSYPVVRWEGLRQAVDAGAVDGRPAPVVLDVRRDDEYAESHLRGAANIPLHDLLDRLHDAPGGRLWVHCGSGYRAGVAASILSRAGREVVHVDDDWDRVGEVGLSVVTATTAPA